MTDENKELMVLLEKLKKMQPEGAKGKEEAPKSVEKQGEAEEIVSKAAAKKRVAVPSQKKPQLLTSEIYQSILELQKDIKSKEAGLKFDMQKLDELITALTDREEEFESKESAVAKKDEELSRQLDDLRKIKKELQGVLK